MHHHNGSESDCDDNIRDHCSHLQLKSKEPDEQKKHQSISHVSSECFSFKSSAWSSGEGDFVSDMLHYS